MSTGLRKLPFFPSTLFLLSFSLLLLLLLLILLLFLLLRFLRSSSFSSSSFFFTEYEQIVIRHRVQGEFNADLRTDFFTSLRDFF